MAEPRVVLDTNVVVAGLRSRHGASHRLLTLVGTGRFEFALSVALVLEYEHAARNDSVIQETYADEEIGEIIDFLCAEGFHQRVHYLWRPQTNDPADEHVLELAVAAGCDTIVTYDKNDLSAAEHFGIRLRDAREFLLAIGEIQ